MPAIWSYGRSNASRSTNTARSGGVSRSIIRSIASDSVSRRSTVSSGPNAAVSVSAGSGSQGPT
jgi:hypothetical protein